ncbi:hypothetical protein Mapa_006234 [Marchantia paleacea]|nr:hypothetical protein Mapa_006234 [Marchantia paleacea]
MIIPTSSTQESTHSSLTGCPRLRMYQDLENGDQLVALQGCAEILEPKCPSLYLVGHGLLANKSIQCMH